MISSKRACDLFSYDGSTGDLIRKIPVSNQPAGVSAGTTHKTNHGKKYRYVGADGKVYLAHRLIWLMQYGAFPTKEIDHINGDSLDNKLSNLREVSTAENHRNYKRAKNNTSGVTGVCYYKQTNRWVARIKVNKKYINLGYFKDFDGAVDARKKAERRYDFHPNHGNDA